MNTSAKNLSFCLMILSTAFLISCGGRYPVNSQESQPQLQFDLATQLDSLIEVKDFFTAREMFEDHRKMLSDFQQLKIGMFLDNVFNDPLSSLRKYSTLTENYEKQLNDSIYYNLANVARDNHLKLYDYKMVKEIQETILLNFPAFFSEEEQKDLENTLIIWRALEDAPIQEVVIPGEVRLPLHRDKAGLKNLEVTAGNSSQNFIFDTGANFSTITESTAKQFNLILLDGKFEVNAITGNKVLSQIAVAPEINLGEIQIKNAVFLVFPDEALAFPQIDFQINGILGFPVIEALREIQITRNDEFIIPLKQTEFDERNLAIDFLTPLLYLKDEHTSGSYTFDTGASNTMLYNTYYQQLDTSVTSSLPEVDYSFGGAGGHITKKGVYHNFTPEIHGRIVSIDSVMVLKEPITTKHKYLGNIGQDLIGKFGKMTINFERMFVRFD